MTTKVEKSILVNVPVGTVYNQWTQFEQFPKFMSGVKEIKQLTDRTMHWVAEIAGVKREWDAQILEQVPDAKIAWAATSGATNAGAVYFEAVSTEQTSVRLSLEYDPEGVVEKIGDKLNIIEKQAESDLERFKAFIEDERYATGAWRGSVNEGAAVGTPGVEEAAESRGDSGKAGVSAKAVLGAAAVAGVAAAAVAKSKSGDDEVVETTTVTTDYAVDVPASGYGDVPATTYVEDVSTTTYATDVPATGAAFGTAVPGTATTGDTVSDTPALSGAAGTPGSADPYAAEDEAVTEPGENHRDAGGRLTP